jgi:hypothetical protein
MVLKIYDFPAQIQVLAYICFFKNACLPDFHLLSHQKIL